MDLTGTTLGQYELVERIGQGGMATVYKAHQSSLDRYVAIKVLTSDLSRSEDFVTRFEREAKTIAKLRHRNILTIFDYGQQDGQLYLAMEYVTGGTLKEQLGWPLKLSYAVEITRQIGDAMAYAHKQGVIHRDIKPANILIADDDWLLLSDFGLVKMAEDSLQLTISGTSLGTPQYMSPEQAQAMELDHRSDIYSLGVVLYEAITGQPPFGTDNPVAIIMKHLHEPIIPPHTLRPDLPTAMERILLKALAKSPEDRYQRMEDFLDDLQTSHKNIADFAVPDVDGQPMRRQEPAEDFIATPLTPPPPTKLRRRKKPLRRRVLGFAIGLILLLIIGLTLFIFRDYSMTALASVLGQTPIELPTLPSELTLESSTATPATTPETETTAIEFTPSTVPPLPTATAPVINTPIPITPTSQPLNIQSRVWSVDNAEMVFVPAGEFTMGSETLGDDERPVRPVDLDSFWIDRYEVTNEQFSRFIQESGYQTEAEQRGWSWVKTGEEWIEVNRADWRHPRGPDSNIDGKTNHPVVHVSWNDAAAYCNWAGKRLPSEAEWEKAAKGPSSGTIEQNYAWGEKFETNKANTEEADYNDTTPIGNFSPQGDSPYGAADMAGNAWEWVADWYDSSYYQQAPTVNPLGPATGTDKVLRGGSWLFDQLYARTAFRYNLRPDYTYDFTGFRCSSSE